MNYRHAFHAGNFADVFKHAVLCRILHYLREKPAAFRVIDTHAGAGLYDLAGREASRGGEWHDGIERLHGRASSRAPVAALLAPYLDVIGALNERGRLKIYPGSPALARAWLRPQDRLIACEIEPKAAAALRQNLRGDTRIKTLEIDGWTALAAYVPPKERRGLVLVDPPFEAGRRFSSACRAGLPPRTANGPPASTRSGTRSRAAASRDALAKSLRRLGIAKMLRARTDRRAAQRPDPPQRLRPDPGQPAVDAGKRAFRAAAGAGRHSGAGRQGRIPASIGSPARGRRSPADGVAPFHRRPVGV